MKNKIQVHIAGREYRLASDQEPEYMRQVASFVNEQFNQLSGSLQTNLSDCAVLTALNIADTLFQERSQADNLRRQLKQALDDAAQAELKLKEAQRELSRRKSGRKPPAKE